MGELRKGQGWPSAKPIDNKYLYFLIHLHGEVREQRLLKAAHLNTSLYSPEDKLILRQ